MLSDGLVAATAVADELDGHWDERDQHDEHDGVLDVLTDPWERTAQPVAENRETDGPDCASDDVELDDYGMDSEHDNWRGQWSQFDVYHNKK